MKLRLMVLSSLVAVFVGALAVKAQRGGPDPGAEPFKGVTTDGTVRAGLFSVRSTGVSTAPVKEAAEAFIASLTPEQRKGTLFSEDDTEWRRWNNVHRAARAGIGFKEMTEGQRARAFNLLKAGLSARGLEKTRNIM